jgi:hypothetical protein
MVVNSRTNPGRRISGFLSTYSNLGNILIPGTISRSAELCPLC